MIYINIQFFGDNGGSGAGGGGGYTAANVAANAEIDSSKDWQNDLKPQSSNPAGIDRLSNEKRVAAIMKQLDCSREDAEKYAAAIEAYGNHRSEMEEAVHNVNSAYHGLALNLESYIKRANRWAGGDTYRALNVNAETFDKSNNIGETISFDGTSTWYSNKSNAKGDVRLVSPTQSKGTGVNHLSVHTGEKEVLASDASRYKIRKKYWEGKILYVQVEEI